MTKVNTMNTKLTRGDKAHKKLIKNYICLFDYLFISS